MSVKLKSHMADWIINYNDASDTWRAVTRDNQVQLFNGGKDIISSKSLDTLITILNKTNGEKYKIKNLIV